MIHIDQMNRCIELDQPPGRIISLVPSQTELLFYLGLDEEVVGITKFCVHPKEKWKEKAKVGGTKKLHLDRIEALRPDLIIGNKEENERSQIESLEKRYRVWMSDIYNLADALDMIKKIGALTGKANEAERLAREIANSFGKIIHDAESGVGSAKADPVPVGYPHLPGKKIRVAYLIWYRPWMVAAAGTFIDSLLDEGGFQNVFDDKTRYPEVTLEEIASRKPDLIMLSSEPFPFRKEHEDMIREYMSQTAVAHVDGELFSWYGNRLMYTAKYLADLRKNYQYLD